MRSTANARVLVTGGSRGIGAAASLLCAAARLGRRRQLHARRGRGRRRWSPRSRRAAAARARGPRRRRRRRRRCWRCSRRIDRELPPLGGLVNNAGVVDIGGPRRRDDVGAPAAHVRDQRLRQLLLRARGDPAHDDQARRRRAGAHAGGAIVNVSSAAAKLGAPGQYVDYAAAKGAIETFTIGLAKEVAAEGIRVNAVRPGIIETEIHASGGTPDRVAQMRAAGADAARRHAPTRSAEAIVWLLSDPSSYTTGSIVEVTGGR